MHTDYTLKVWAKARPIFTISPRLESRGNWISFIFNCHWASARGRDMADKHRL